MDINISKSVYHKLADEESRYIYRKRIEYLFTGDRKCIKEMTECGNRTFHPAITVKGFDECGTLSKGKNIVYGLKGSAPVIKQLKERGANTDYICDSYITEANKGENLNVPLITPGELFREHSDANIIRHHSCIQANADPALDTVLYVY